MNAYLSLKTPGERKFAAGHVLWLREQSKNVLDTDPAEADELEVAAEELETAIRRAELESNPAS